MFQLLWKQKKINRLGFRYYSQVLRDHPLQIAVVGSGPSAFYTIHQILQKKTNEQQIKIDIFEKLPVPFGLSRYGVAPDHPEVKKCEERFQEIMENLQNNVNFFGNVTIGEDLSIMDLKKNYNIVLFAYGCSKGKELTIPGANHPAVIPSQKFVGWYNGHPELQDFEPPLDQVEDVIIIGNGNVALDVARILLSPLNSWSRTDISENAIKMLQKSKVKNVKIVARRSFLQSAFTNKELRELLELKKQGVFLKPIDEEVLKMSKLLEPQLSRVNKRRYALIKKYFESNEQIPEGSKTWDLNYLLSPVQITSNPNNSNILSSVKFQKNELIENMNPPGTTEIRPIDDFVNLKSEMVISSIGYQGTKLKTMDEVGIKFIDGKGIIDNKFSRVLDKNGEVLKGFYVTGWIQYGAKGVIASTMMNSFSTGEEILKDINNEEFEIKSGSSEIISKLNNYSTWKDWKKIDNYEKSKGERSNKSRQKILKIDQMLKMINE